MFPFLPQGRRRRERLAASLIEGVFLGRETRGCDSSWTADRDELLLVSPEGSRRSAEVLLLCDGEASSQTERQEDSRRAGVLQEGGEIKTAEFRLICPSAGLRLVLPAWRSWRRRRARWGPSNCITATVKCFVLVTDNYRAGLMWHQHNGFKVMEYFQFSFSLYNIAFKPSVCFLWFIQTQSLGSSWTLSLYLASYWPTNLDKKQRDHKKDGKHWQHQRKSTDTI